ncbi:MAG: hypothetical protein NUV53_03330 [Patescibacteria group bacterium]|nr:hypothetical protein [Patescibacteria group bacterium]
MTFIKPNNKKNILNVMLVCMVCVLVVSAIGLVFVYNRFADIDRDLRASKEEFQKLEAKNAKLRSDLLSLFDSARLATFASAYSLVREKNPAYIETDTQWQFASGW